MGNGTEVAKILDSEKVASPGAIGPRRAVILITIDTSLYKGEKAIHAIFDISTTDYMVSGERFGYVTHIDKNNRSRGTITGYGSKFVTCTPNVGRITLFQAPGQRLDYILSFPAGYVNFILKERDSDAISPIFLNRRTRVFDYRVPAYGVGGPIDLGIFRIQGQEGDTSVSADDERAVSGTMHWGEIRFRTAPMVYEIVPPPVVFETQCLGYPKFH